jgi:hypothetical protein
MSCIIKSKGDGHCLLHSVLASAKAQSIILPDYYIVVNALMEEFTSSPDTYEACGPDVIGQGISYVVDRRWSLDIVDAVPLALCNSLGIEISILEQTPSPPRL